MYAVEEIGRLSIPTCWFRQPSIFAFRPVMAFVLLIFVFLIPHVQAQLSSEMVSMVQADTPEYLEGKRLLRILQLQQDLPYIFELERSSAETKAVICASYPEKLYAVTRRTATISEADLVRKRCSDWTKMNLAYSYKYSELSCEFNRLNPKRLTEDQVIDALVRLLAATEGNPAKEWLRIHATQDYFFKNWTAVAEWSLSFGGTKTDSVKSPANYGLSVYNGREVHSRCRRTETLDRYGNDRIAMNIISQRRPIVEKAARRIRELRKKINFRLESIR